MSTEEVLNINYKIIYPLRYQIFELSDGLPSVFLIGNEYFDSIEDAHIAAVKHFKENPFFTAKITILPVIL